MIRTLQLKNQFKIDQLKLESENAPTNTKI